MRCPPTDFFVTLVAAALLASGCSFAVQGTDPSLGTGGGGASDNPSLEPPVPTAPAPQDMAVARPADLALRPDLAKPLPPPPAPTSLVGQACDKDKACGGNGLVCVTHLGLTGIFGVDFPGGYCSQICANDAACPSGSLCRTIKGVNVCVAQCPPSACRSGYSCCGSEDEGVCAPATICD
jgi:hypothetical protein